MNNVSAALKIAGVKLPPVKKRIWLWLKDHPKKTYNEIATALNISKVDSATQLGIMYNRGMLSKVRGAYTPGSSASINLWPIIYDEYELLPPRARALNPLDRPISTQLIHPQPLPTPRSIDVTSLKLSEARALYVELKKYFEA